jgi:hypothetical protein
MADKGINIKDRDFILYATPPKVGKSQISYIDQIEYLRKVNQRLEKELRMILDNEYGMEKEEIDADINRIIKGEWDKE